MYLSLMLSIIQVNKSPCEQGILGFGLGEIDRERERERERLLEFAKLRRPCDKSSFLLLVKRPRPFACNHAVYFVIISLHIFPCLFSFLILSSFNPPPVHLVLIQIILFIPHFLFTDVIKLIA